MGEECFMRYVKLKEYVNSENWEMAHQELEQILEEEMDDVTAILASAVYFHEGDLNRAYKSISKGLAYNYANSELYFMLGNYYEHKNVNQAWLCYENAEFYCEDEEDLKIIRQRKKEIELCEEWNVQKVSIVILSYNLAEVCRQCVESIRKNNLYSSYEIVVVDNASTDGITEWLKAQRDIKLICNKENKGFPYGCNQGIKICEPENDILLLNNDTIISPNSIFWLRMGLYEEAKVGATGSVSNFVFNNQRIDKRFDTFEEYLQYAIKHNIPMKNPYEKKVWLAGFAMLIKRTALDSVGLLDINFSPGDYEDNDIGIRLQLAGWKLVLCHNSFIFHYGSGNGSNHGVWNEVERRNRELFKNKWGFDIQYYTNSRTELIDFIDKKKEDAFQVLEVGCGCGATLARIDYL